MATGTPQMCIRDSYHMDYKPPKEAGKCDRCGGELVIRKDDQPETILERLKVYHELTEPLKDYYKGTGKLVIVEAVSYTHLDVYKRQGKGSPEYWVAVVKPGRVMFEIGGVSEELAREAMRLAMHKLPIKCKFVKKEENGGEQA